MQTPTPAPVSTVRPVRNLARDYDDRTLRARVTLRRKVSARLRTMTPPQRAQWATAVETRRQIAMNAIRFPAPGAPLDAWDTYNKATAREAGIALLFIAITEGMGTHERGTIQAEVRAALAAAERAANGEVDA